MIRFIAAAVTLLLGPAAWADDLAPTGTLRATFLGTNPVQGRLDPKTLADGLRVN